MPCVWLSAYLSGAYIFNNYKVLNQDFSNTRLFKEFWDTLFHLENRMMHRNNNYSFIQADTILKFTLVIFCHSTTITKMLCSGGLFCNWKHSIPICCLTRGYLLCNHHKYNIEISCVTLVNMCAIKDTYNRFPNIVS